MKTPASIQSLDRGLKILELLSENGGMTASAIARELGIHQSSASRLLNSLVKAGFCHKPEYHLFALDFGVLLFAGKTLLGFPLVEKAAVACNRVLLEHGYSANVAVLYKEHLVYLADCKNGGSMRLINDDAFPVHQSSIGRLLAWELGEERMIEIMNASMAQKGVVVSAESIHAEVTESVDKLGFLFMRGEFHNRFNAAQSFEFQGRRAALAVYSETEDAEPEDVRPILERAINQITGKDLSHE